MIDKDIKYWNERTKLLWQVTKSFCLGSVWRTNRVWSWPLTWLCPVNVSHRICIGFILSDTSVLNPKHRPAGGHWPAVGHTDLPLDTGDDGGSWAEDGQSQRTLDMRNSYFNMNIAEEVRVWWRWWLTISTPNTSTYTKESISKGFNSLCDKCQKPPEEDRVCDRLTKSPRMLWAGWKDREKEVREALLT